MICYSIWDRKRDNFYKMLKVILVFPTRKTAQAYIDAFLDKELYVTVESRFSIVTNDLVKQLDKASNEQWDAHNNRID